MDKLRYPIGLFEPSLDNSDEFREKLIKLLPEISETLKRITKKLTREQLLVPYRLDGWTIQQIIHHMADNDMNAFIRFKRALTEDEPVASSYREDLWAELSDYQDAPIEVSIRLLEAIHNRFYKLLIGLRSEDFNKKFRTQLLGTITTGVALQRFIWHNQHHIAQIESLINRMEWV